MVLVSVLFEILKKPTIGDMLFELMVFMVPVWIAVVVGILVGWAWKPKWVNMNLDSTAIEGDSKKLGFMALPQFLPLLSSLKQYASIWISGFGIEKDSNSVSSCDHSSLSEIEKEKSRILDEDDLKHLHRLVEEKDGGPFWIKMMDKSIPNMTYQAWRRDTQTGPPQYRSRTIYEDVTPEMLRDFFWDDEFRLKWDDMLIHAETLEECTTTGAMVVHWVRKFPFFCSDREYIIGRRIWEAGQNYYCVTKGVPYSSVPRCDKPRRVDLCYSSWCIRPAESKRDGRMTACEVLLFHHEDPGIPWEIVKLGVRQGMWGAVKKIDPGLRAYQKFRSSEAPLSQCASMAQINTKISIESLESKECTISGEMEIKGTDSSADKASKQGIPKMLVVGGAVILACTLDRGLLTKALIFGVARRFANNGRRL